MVLVLTRRGMETMMFNDANVEDNRDYNDDDDGKDDD